MLIITDHVIKFFAYEAYMHNETVIESFWNSKSESV